MPFSSSSSLFQLLLLLTTVVINIQKVSTSGLFQFRFDSFDNPLSRDQDGVCCSDSSVSSSSFSSSSSSSSSFSDLSLCSSPCRIYFRVCLKHYQNNIDIESPCTFGEVTTQVLGEDRISSPGYIVPIPFNFSWPVSFLQFNTFLQLLFLLSSSCLSLLFPFTDHPLSISFSSHRRLHSFNNIHFQRQPSSSSRVTTNVKKHNNNSTSTCVFILKLVAD